MHLVEVDVIGLQTPQARVARGADVARREPAVVRPVGHRAEHLRGEHDLLAPLATLREPRADDLLGAARALRSAVAVRGVEEVDAELERAIHDRVRVGLGRQRPEVHRAEADRADTECGAAETSVFHVMASIAGERAALLTCDSFGFARRYPALPSLGPDGQAPPMRAFVALVGCALVLGACSSSSSSGKSATTNPPRASTAPASSTTTTVATGPHSVGHVFVINLENKDYANTWGPGSQARYLNTTLLAHGKLLSDYYGIGHASLDNYIAEISGQAPNPKTQGDCTTYVPFVSTGTGTYQQALGSGCLYPASVKTVADQLTAAGKTWRGYMEDMGTPCRHPALGQVDMTIAPKPEDMYATRHNPFVYFASLTGSSACAQNDVDFSHLATDLKSVATTPNLSFITPNVCHDGHDQPCVDSEPGGYVSADRWLAAEVPVLMASPAYKADGMIIVTFDESAGADATACCHTPPDPNSAQPGGTGPGGGRIGAVIVSPRVKAGTTDATPYNHYALLCSIEDIFGLSHLGFAGASGLTCFGKDVYDGP